MHPLTEAFGVRFTPGYVGRASATIFIFRLNLLYI